MADEKLNENDNVVDFDSNEGAKVKLLISQLKNLLEIQAQEFADQYVKEQPECPEYLIADNFGVKIVEMGIAKLIDMKEWDDEQMLSLSAHALMSVIIENIADWYGDEDDEEEDDVS